MKQEFQMAQQEMDHILEINRTVSSPVMLVGGVNMGNNKQEAINSYWAELGNKYGFKPMTVEGSAKGKLFFLAEPTPPPPPPKTQTEIEMDKYNTLSKIVKQLEVCNYESKEGILTNNVAFLSLKRMAEKQ